MIAFTSKFITLLAVLPLAMAYPSISRRQGDPQTSLTLDANAIMKGLQSDGQTGPDVTAGQVRSLTSSNNFINFCLTQGVPLTNGVQEKGGSCNQTPMGRIVAIAQMPSSKFVFPENLSDIGAADTPFTIKMAISKVQTGNFVNPATNYYAAPQQVNDQGIVIGHSHVTVEKISDFKQKEPLDPNVFAFFKGLNDVANNGILEAKVDKGLPAGSYRMCSINAAANHQPILVAVAQHGSIDDCSYFSVAAAGGNNGGNAGGNGGNGGNGGGNVNAGACKKDVTVQPGDTCDNIARITAITTNDLKALNSAINAACSNLTPGQKLCVQK